MAPERELVGYDALITLMRVRYDFYSARAVLERALREAGVAEKAAFSPSELRQLADVMAKWPRDRVEELVGLLRQEASAVETRLAAVRPPKAAAKGA